MLKKNLQKLNLSTVLKSRKVKLFEDEEEKQKKAIELNDKNLQIIAKVNQATEEPINWQNVTKNIIQRQKKVKIVNVFDQIAKTKANTA